MADVFLKIVNMSISACWIVLAIILLRFIFKKAPKWVNCMLWGLAGLRLILPFSPESIFSLIPSAEFVPGELIHSNSSVDVTGTEIFNYIGNNPVSYDLGISNGSLVFNEITAPDGNYINPLLIITYIASIVWLTGIAALLIYTIVSYLKLKRRIGTAVLLRDNIYQNENVTSPFVLGIIKPKIYLPFNINPEDMDHVIAHEQAHIKRRDYLWKPLGFLILTLHWFNPLVWAGYILLCRDIELACDEKVIKALGGEQRADYSQALLSCSVNRRAITACPLAFGETDVKNRVKSVLNYKKPAFWVIIVAIIVSITVAVCFLTTPLTSNEIPNGMYSPSDEVYSDNSAQDLSNQQIEIKTKGGMHVYHFIDEVLSTGGLYKEVNSKKELSALFSCNSEFSVDENLKTILKNNKNAWYDKPFDNIKSYPYILMAQKDGSLCIAFADFENGEPTKIRYICKLVLTKQNETAVTEEATVTEEESTVQLDNYPPEGSFENPCNIGDSIRVKHGDINQKGVVYDYNASITIILTDKEAEEKLKELASNYEEEKAVLESFDLYLARVHIKYNEESTVKDRLPTDFGVTAVRYDKQLQFIDPRFEIPDNVFKAADGEFYFWAPVLAVKNTGTPWLSITVGTYQGAPGIISGVCFKVPQEEKPVENTVEFSGSTYIRRCGEEVNENLGIGTMHLPEFPDSIKLKDYGIVFCDEEWDERTIIDVAIQGWAKAYHMESDGELEGSYKVLKFKMTIPEQMIEVLTKRPGQYEEILADLARNYYYLIPLSDTHYGYFHFEGDNEELADSIVKNAQITINLLTEEQL